MDQPEDILDSLLGYLNKSLPAIRQEMVPAAWEAFGKDLVQVRVLLIDESDEKRRLRAFFKLRETCLKYEPVLQLLPDDSTMLTGTAESKRPLEPTKGLPDKPTDQRLNELIEWSQSPCATANREDPRKQSGSLE